MIRTCNRCYAAILSNDGRCEFCDPTAEEAEQEIKAQREEDIREAQNQIIADLKP